MAEAYEEMTRIALEIEMESEIESSYSNLVESFGTLAQCERTWDTTSAEVVNQVRERSSATQAITRRPVRLDLRSAEVVAPSRPALHFQNANGGDLFILPGLLLVFGSHQDFALVRLTELNLEHSVMAFQETEDVPADSRQIGETWAKVNKDGSPDRRFTNNFRIPVMEYGRLRFSSPSGLNEEFMFSNSRESGRFAEVFAQHQSTLPEPSIS